jgi:hypothetical protein
MSAEFLASLWVALEDARIACIAAQNKNDMPAIKKTNKSWSKIRRAIEKVRILRAEQAEEERFQLALKLALEERRKEKEEYEPQSRSCYRCGRIYSHATKEDDDEDTGYCPKCRALPEGPLPHNSR